MSSKFSLDSLVDMLGHDRIIAKTLRKAGS